MRENVDQNNSEYEHFSRSAVLSWIHQNGKCNIFVYYITFSSSLTFKGSFYLSWLNLFNEIQANFLKKVIEGENSVYYYRILLRTLSSM